MGASSAKVFPQPQSYGQANVSQVSQVTPQGIAAPQVLLPDQAGAGLGVNAPAVTPPVAPRINHGGRGKFFGDQELDDNGNLIRGGGVLGQGGQQYKKTVLPPPVKLPHLPPGSGY